MSESILIDQNLDKQARYEALIPQLKALIEGETDLIANMANLAAALKYSFHFFWVGFYLVKSNELVLGPFQGPVACTRLKPGKGVCGSSYATKKTILVPDVSLFEGHIACSSDTQSEIVLPIFKNNEVVAVLDIDSEYINHFDAVDEFNLKKITNLIESTI